MPTISPVRPHHLNKIHDELLVAFPALAATLRVEGPYGERRVKDPANPGQYVTLPAEPPDTLHLSWPDASGVTVEQIQAIVSAHDPTPPPIDPLEGVNVSAVDALVAQAQAIASVADAKAVVVAEAQALRKLVRYLRRRAGVAE